MVFDFLRHSIGYLIIAIGLVHNVLGFILYKSVLLNIVKRRFFDTVRLHQDDRMAALWFLMAGFLLILLGYLVHWCLYVTGVGVPMAAAIMYFAIAVVLTIVFPRSGAWAALVAAIILLTVAK